MTRLVAVLGLSIALVVPAAAFAAEKKAEAKADAKGEAKADGKERKCKGCGARLLGGETSCPACGTEVGAIPEAPETTTGLCLVGEKAILSCEMAKGGKTLSVCASKDFDPKAAVPSGTIEYRIGKPGKVERSWPESGTDPKKAFVYKAEAKASGAKVVAISYEGKDGAVYSAYVRYMAQRVVAAGELVTGKGKKKAQEFECKVPGSADLGDVVDASFSRDAFTAAETDAVTALLKKQ
ncbi:MAG: hypothetical protein QM765_25065 [Myxococcales bacterium]